MIRFVLLGGHAMRSSNYIKEIVMNDSGILLRTKPEEEDKISDLENHRDTFIFHHSLQQRLLKRGFNSMFVTPLTL
jgi:hypothetical protein